MRKSYVLTSLVAFFLGTEFSGALTPQAQQLVNMETKANAIAVRDNRPVAMPHFEIPLELIETDFAERFSEQYRRHLIFERAGKKYVRWVLNPEDTLWGEELRKYYQTNHNLDLQTKYYFTGYQTASRSYIIEDPNREIQISVKSSTNKTGGQWSDKKQEAADAHDSRMNADFLKEMERRLAFEHIAFLDEPAALKAPGPDQAVLFRDLGELNRSAGKLYVPGFSVLHEEVGRSIAAKNGSSDPYQFWTEHYVRAVARAMGELAARTGLQFDSPHSQNFLVELDTNYKPTGKIVIRDMADFFVNETMMKALHPNPEKYFREFSYENNIKKVIPANFGPLHGNHAPTWVNAEQYAKWQTLYYNEYESIFSHKTGLKIMDYAKGQRELSGRYFMNSYVIPADPQLSGTPAGASNPRVENFWNNIKKYKTPRGLLNCSFVMSM